MVSLVCTLLKFQMLLPEDGGRPSKHVAGKFVCIHTVRLVCAHDWFLNNIRYNKLHVINTINIYFCFPPSFINREAERSTITLSTDG